MSARARLVAALACWLGAALLVLAAGLPEHPATIGVIRPDGTHIAPVIGANAPLFSTRTHQGHPFTLDTAQPTVLNFWATWCAPCAVEMPELQILQNALPGVRVIAVNAGEDAATIAAWAQQYALTYPLLLDPTGQIAALYAVRGQPTTFVIASGGMIRAIFYGPVDASRLRAALAPLLTG